jgi:gamma-tubulin complex component 3
MHESLLVRDTLYLMQGISGKYVRFSSLKENEKNLIFVVDSVSQNLCNKTRSYWRIFQKSTISPSTQTLILRLAELGYLYSRIENFVRERDNAHGVGMIEQSLCHYLQTQLTEYYRLIAVLETHLSSTQRESTGTSSVDEETGLSLRRLDVWVTEWRLRMRMMSVCVEGARGRSKAIWTLEGRSNYFLRFTRRSPGKLDP